MRGSILDLGIASDGSHRWKLRVHLGTDIVTGRPRKPSRNFRGGRRAAEDALNSMLVEVKEKRSAGTTANVSYLFAEWIRLQQSQGLSSTTIGTRISYIKNRINPAIGNVPVGDLTARHLDRLYSDLSGELSPRSVNHVHATIRRALAQAVKWGWIEKNVAELASPPRVTNEKVVSIDPSALTAFLTEAHRRDPRIERIIALAALSGARRGELCGLKWSDCDIDDRQLTIRRSVKWSSQRGVEVGPTKTHAERVVALDEIGVEVIRRQMMSVSEISEGTGLELPDDPWLFPSPDLVSPWNPDRVTGAFRRVAVAIGKPQFHFHSLRHFSATEMIAAGVDVRTVAARLGHADASVTLRVYAHALPERDRAAAELLGSKVSLLQPSGMSEDT